MENTNYYYIREPFEDAFIISESALNETREWYKAEYADVDDLAFDDYYDIFPVFDFDIDNGLFINGAGDTLYICGKSGDGWIVNFEDSADNAAEYQSRAFQGNKLLRINKEVS